MVPQALEEAAFQTLSLPCLVWDYLLLRIPHKEFIYWNDHLPSRVHLSATSGSLSYSERPGMFSCCVPQASLVALEQNPEVSVM